MNKTSDIVAPSIFLQTKGDKQEVIDYLSEEYPGIRYILETDSFEYRGIEFDYFCSGIGMKEDKIYHTYLLIDKKQYYNNWLFAYGDKEERWKEFLKKRENLIYNKSMGMKISAKAN